MIKKTISELLEEKYISILCPTAGEYISLFVFLSKWKDLGWKSGRSVKFEDGIWTIFGSKTVFCIRLRNSKGKSLSDEKKYQITFCKIDDDRIPTSHIFTVEAFNDYIYSQGASKIFKYSLD